jgi:hypothetical protein
LSHDSDQTKIAQLPVVPDDRAMLRVVLVNLLGNAEKFPRLRQPGVSC